jgi:hypothetical protein
MDFQQLLKLKKNTKSHTHNKTQHNTTQHVAESASLSDQKLSFILSFLFPEQPPLPC